MKKFSRKGLIFPVIYLAFATKIYAELIGTEVGTVGVAGTDSLDNDIYTVTGSGADIFDTADSFHFLRQPLTGDGTIIAKVLSQTNSNVFAKAGVMMRNTTDPSDAEASVFLHPAKPAEFDYRFTQGTTAAFTPMSSPPSSSASSETPSETPSIQAPYWVKLTRAGDVFSGYVSPDGKAWTQIGTQTISMNHMIEVGLAVCAHDNSLLSTATFSNVSIVEGTPPTPIPSPTPTPSPTPISSHASSSTSTTDAGGVAAVQAKSFLNSIGVCSHMTQGLDLEGKVATCITYAGIRVVRDDGSINPAAIQNFLKLHAATGVKFSLLPPSANPSDWPTQYDAVADAGALLAVEGTNEPNNEPPTFDGHKSSSTDAMPTAHFQAALYAFAKSDSHLSGIPVFGSSESGGSEPNNVGLQYLTIPTPLPEGVLMPAGIGYADYANAHNYIIGNGITKPVDNTAWQAEDPTLNSNWDGLYGEYGVTWSKHFAGYSKDQLLTLPRVTTETGWYTKAEKDQGQSYPVSLDQQGKLLLNVYLSAYKRGWSYTFVYYLHDSSQGEWGFFDPDYKAKPSGTYLHNLTTILADTTTFTPGSLNYSIADEPSTVHDLLIQKSNGTFYLVVWDDRPVGEGTDSVTVNLGGTYSVNQYDPTEGTTATSLGNVSSVTLSLTDHPLILEIPGPSSGQ